MTKLLLHSTLSRTAAKKLSFPDLTKKASQYALILWMVFLATPICGQHVDTWFTADRAVNISPTPVGQFHLFTPLPPADGTSVTTWYDFIDGSSQDAIQHPTPLLYPLAYPDGFGHFQTDGVTPFGSPAFLDPVGPIPGVPILRRNDMNFNPSIEFDGSGVGNALHFRSESREEITVFIVFKARGMGNTAESQRLLFGGDIDTHHSSTTNLSIGISDGNRFSIGRTWTTWSDFESGGIDLQGLPTIGVLIRQVDTDIILEDEVLNTQVNGLPDISIIKNHPGIERDLYLFNKLGKHFNSNDSNRNLTGNIAEILLADGPLDTNSIQRVESYLAIKYGITLNNIGGQLGSMVGNQGYTYLAADGTPIWLTDPTYLYDIAGLGRDRYDDFESGLPNDIGDLKLRYNLHQRIAKSENIEAIVTMSTNSDFINDNLDTSRPIIDNTTANSVSTTTTSVLHNYLLWGNNHGDINQTAIELPTNYSTRMGREWKIQKTVSPGGVDPINGVSVRIDLSSSNILNNGNCGDLVLIIDTDGDGNFLTGTQTEIAATSVDGSQNAYFNNIDFEHQDVFTIAFRDNTPPTASNPSTITVCDSTPIPDPSVVTDEADNCAVDTVTHIGDISDGLINPETITRIYRVTDIYNNYLDVQQTIYVYITPNINDIPDQEVCESYTLPQITGTDLSGNEAYYDLPGGPLGGGNIYSEGNIITTDMTLYIYDERGGVSRVCYDEESFNVTINNTPLADAPADVESCDSYTLPALANGNYFDAPGGGGNALSAGDDITTTTTLYVFSPGTGSCPDVENSFNVTINNTPLADAPADVESCDSYTLPALANGNYFDAPGGGGNALSAGDDITTTTTLYVFSPGTGSCPDVENSFNVTINNTPLADAPADVESCDSYTLPALANGNYFDAPGGGGNALSAGDDITTTTTLYVFSPGTGSCPDVENSFNVTINNTPLADAPADVESCDSYTLPALANGNYFDAPGGGGNALSAGDDITTTTTLYVFSPGTGSCPDVENSFNVTINNTPLADAPADVESCDSYTLPALANGNYFDAPGGGGNALSAGDDITTTTTLYVFSPGTGSCPDVENSFNVTINNTPLADAPADVESCDSYTLPALANGNYFDAPGGGGNALSAGDDITTTTTLYVFSPGTGSCPDVENSFNVTINNTPLADAPADVESCDSYTLPALANGNYFDAPGGGGNALSAGDDITTTTTLYVFSPGTGSCPDVENSFNVTINNTPLADAPADVESCDSYTLPALANGNYFDAPGGGGNALSAGDDITTTTTLYVFSPGTGSCPDVENSFNVTINNTPLADAPADVESCDSYTLPALANGNYFDAPGGGGNALSAGDDITTTTTLYVFSPGTGSCPDVENSFNVTINNTPLADAPADVESCDSYTLPALANGNYFDAPGGGGNALSAGDDITTTTTLYVFSPGTGSCPDVENSFNVTINNTPLADAPADVESCDSYTLPALANGNYFDAPGGGGNALSAGDDITTTTTLYVFSPGTGSCPDVENSFNVTINNTPLADAPADVESCDSYTLPALANGNYFDAPGGGGNALSAGDDITTTTTLYVFSPGTGSCPDVENSFEVDITGFEISTNVENETCWQSQDGIVHVNVFNTNLPLTVQLDSMPSTIFNQNAFSFDNLATGNHTLTVIDQNGCQSEANFEILAGGPNLDASIEPIYLCDSGLSSNTIAVTLSDPSIGNAVLYALDSTSPNDFIMTPNFENIAPGNHSLSILHTNGCLQEIPFNIGQVEPVSLSLANINVNEITATAMGGFPPYTYYFEDNPGTPSNTFSIDRSGTFIVRVMDRNGCETSETITLNLIEISIPNFFTPNNDGQNDYWRPRNMEWFPDVQTYIFDRYGRKIKIIGAFDYGWDGQYESKPMPSGDYWYIVKLNDGSGREFVGHFTLYR